jgi:hypothetical protein
VFENIRPKKIILPSDEKFRQKKRALDAGYIINLKMKKTFFIRAILGG